jgi:hypothetical protein
MSNDLSELLKNIGAEFKEAISRTSEFILEVDLGKRAKKLGYSDIAETFRDVEVVVPLKEPVQGLKVRIDGRTFVNYAQLVSGIAVPTYVAREAGLPYDTFVANDSMIRIFA